jgi:hypothetical protein
MARLQREPNLWATRRRYRRIGRAVHAQPIRQATGWIDDSGPIRRLVVGEPPEGVAAVRISLGSWPLKLNPPDEQASEAAPPS